MCRWVPVEVQQSSAIKAVNEVVLLPIPGDQAIPIFIGGMQLAVAVDLAGLPCYDQCLKRVLGLQEVGVQTGVKARLTNSCHCQALGTLSLHGVM